MPDEFPKIGPRVPLPSINGKKRAGGAAASRGEFMHAIPDTNRQFTVPDGVTSISCVCVGAGGGGVTNGSVADDCSSGGGGGLAWANNIPVVPGDIILLQPGLAGHGANNDVSTSAGGGLSSIIQVNFSTVCQASGGTGGTIGFTAAGGAVIVGDGGGSGGSGANVQTTGESYSTGGGAGGYSGNGGTGRATTTGDLTGNGGSGGGGGSGGVSGAGNRCGGSGGTDVFGEGTSGAGGANNGGPGGGGSGGQPGGVSAGAINFSSAGDAGIYGAGGSVANPNTAPRPSIGLSGAHGACRVVFGAGREFPSTDVGPS